MPRTQSQTVPALLRAATVALFSAVMMIYFGVRLFGDLAVLEPRRVMAHWSVDGRLGSHAERQKLLSRLLIGTRVSPWNADRRMDLARFYTWHLHQSARQSQRHAVYARRARKQILSVVRRRPTWGLAWAALAENSVVSGQHEPVTHRFLEKALRYGAYEPGTLDKIALVGMVQWQRLDQPMRGSIIAAVARLLEINDNPVSLIRLAFSLQWQNQLRPLLRTRAQRLEFERQIRRQKS